MYYPYCRRRFHSISGNDFHYLTAYLRFVKAVLSISRIVMACLAAVISSRTAIVAENSASTLIMPLHNGHKWCDDSCRFCVMVDTRHVCYALIKERAVQQVHDSDKIFHFWWQYFF